VLLPLQIVVVPLIEAVGSEFTVTVMQLALLIPQALLAVTHTLPLVLPKVTVMAVVPCPEVIVAPDGTVQL
jgi:hypothetical protein